MNNQIIAKLNVMVDSANSNTFQNPDGHAYLVRELTFRMLKTTTIQHIPHFRFDPREARMIANAAYLHDVGKLLTPNSILNKAGALTEDECEKMRLHTMDGAMLIYFHPSYKELLMQKYAFEIALHHHERIDGNGYPDGLKDGDLAPWLQIVSIADAFAALTEDRSYRPALSPKKAWSTILCGNCGAFHERVLRCLDAHSSMWMDGPCIPEK